MSRFFVYRWRLLTVGKNLSFAWRTLSRGVVNVFRWFWVIFDDCDWETDYFVLAVLEKKFSYVADCIQRYGCHVGSERDVHRLRVCVELCKRLRADEYYKRENYFKGHSGHVRLSAVMQGRRDQEYLMYLVGRYMGGWWD